MISFVLGVYFKSIIVAIRGFPHPHAQRLAPATHKIQEHTIPSGVKR